MKELLLKNAADKLRREMKSENPSDPHTMIQSKVAEALDVFCKQEPKLAEAIIKSQKTFAECCKNILRDTQTDRYISDFKAYQRAVEFYVPDAKVEFSMSVSIGGGIGKISLMDLVE